MPEPLATTKRKFHKLLDNLTKHANATTTPLPTETSANLSARQRLMLASERVNKRRRVDDQAETPLSSPSIRSNISVRGIVRPQSSPQPATNTPSQRQPLPAFSPWSQETFLQRLQTFSSVALWHPKPEPINEVVWAKRGWRCIGVNTVACVGGCESRVTIDLRRQHTRNRLEWDVLRELSSNYLTLPQDTADLTGESGRVQDEEIEEEEEEEEEQSSSLLQALTERYAVEVISGHTEQCLWRRAGCKDDIYRLQVVRPAIWRPQLHQRYTTLLSIRQSIESVHVTSTSDPTGTTELVEILNDLNSIDPTSAPADTAVAQQAIRIAVHGWHGTSDSHADLLRCDSCFQRVGLWMYQPGYRRRTATLLEESETEDHDHLELDLLNMHREYCPWRNEKSQCASGTLAGLNACEILARVMATYLRERRRMHSDVAAATPAKDIEDMITEGSDDVVNTPKMSREEVDKLDKEREGRLQKLKRLLSLKRPRNAAQSA